MKKIDTKSYVQAQQRTVTFDPKRLKSPQQLQNDPKVKTFQQAFSALSLAGMTTLSEPDAMILDQIQTDIRKKLRMVGFTRMGF